MLASLASTALLMGLAGGPHCLAMCAAPCSVVTGQAMAQETGQVNEHPLQWMPRPGRLGRRLVAYHSGRLLGYATVGALAALAMQSLAWMTQHTAALRPVWTLMHVAVLAWGLMMVLQARQPVWVEQAGRSVWSRVQPLVRAPGGVFVTGFLWALMPCGLLYSALLVASLSANAWEGAAIMALFSAGTSLSLTAGPWLLLRLRGGQSGAWGIRLAGVALALTSGWALWMGVTNPTGLWCA